jgi:hypothetical protein
MKPFSLEINLHPSSDNLLCRALHTNLIQKWHLVVIWNPSLLYYHTPAKPVVSG